jgi:membrane-associated phospholipid phosphatase
VLVDVVPRAVLRRRRPGRLVGSFRTVLAQRWPHTQIRFTLVGLVSWYLTYSAFRNLKSAVPFANDAVWDSGMEHLDRVLWLGHRPAEVLHQVFGVGWAAVFFAAVYLLWIGLIPASLAWALTWTRNHALAAWFVTALGFDWVLGVAAYYAFPSLGPIYTRAGDFASLPDSSTQLQAVMLEDRHGVLADPTATDTLQTIAAFPSLHVGMMVTICLLVQWNTRRLLFRLLAWTMLVLTVLATLYLGWHFFVDVLGGTAVGALAAWLGAVATGHRPPRLSPSPGKSVGTLRRE